AAESASSDCASSVGPYATAPSLLPPMPQAPKPISETERPERTRGLYRTVCDYSIVAGELPLGGVVSVQVGALLVAVPDQPAITVGPAVVHPPGAHDAGHTR